MIVICVNEYLNLPHGDDVEFLEEINKKIYEKKQDKSFIDTFKQGTFKKIIRADHVQTSSIKTLSLLPDIFYTFITIRCHDQISCIFVCYFCPWLWF